MNDKTYINRAMYLRQCPINHDKINHCIMTVTDKGSFFIRCPHCSNGIDVTHMGNYNRIEEMTWSPSLGNTVGTMDALLALCSQLEQQLRNRELAQQYEALQRSRSGSPVSYGRAFRRAKRARRKRAHKRRRCNIKQHHGRQ